MFYREADPSEAAILWHKVLIDEDFDLIQKGLMQYVKADIKGHPPVVGQLIAAAKEIRHQENMRLNQEQFEKDMTLLMDGQAPQEELTMKDVYEKMMTEKTQGLGTPEDKGK